MVEFTITWLLILACAYLVITSLILIRNRYELTPLPEPVTKKKGLNFPFVSILVPARNEEQNIERCIRLACNQDYPNYEVIVLDDHSSDLTPEILARLKETYPRLLRTLQGKEKPDDWLGKPWACSQLALASEGKYILFIDADVFLKQAALLRIVSAFQNYQLDFLTVWPRQITVTFWEQVLIPLVYYTLVTLLPSVYVYRRPRWLPPGLYERTHTLFSAACGQCMSFKKESYLAVNGHTTVKKNVVEDIGLSRMVRSKGLVMRMFEGTGNVECRMYRNEKEIRSGFKKNFFAGFGYSYSFFSASALLHLIVFILPFVTLAVSLITLDPIWLFLSAAAVSLILMQRLMLAVWFGWNPLFAMTHPLAVLWFQLLGLISLFERTRGLPATWKGRQI